MSKLEKALQQGWVLHQHRRFAEAESIYRDVLNQSPSHFEAWCYLGMALHDQRRYEPAVEAYRRALFLQPDSHIALNNLGNSLGYALRGEEADACFQRAIELKPDYVSAYKNRGTVHVRNGWPESALKYYQQALAIDPSDAELRRDLGALYLLLGRFREGWSEYRWRWQEGRGWRPNLAAPVWDGSDISGKTIVLTAEQGLGDTLNFVRFSQFLRCRNAKTIVWCQSSLLPLLQCSENIGIVYADNTPIEEPFDAHCSMLDIADFFSLDAQSIPSDVPYIFPDPHLVRAWADRFPRTSTIRRVGIAWQGNREHGADMFRSIPLTYFEALAELPNVELISLQGGDGIEQLTSWRGSRPITVLDSSVDQSKGAFMDTAAILKHLDLVITSDTAIAHLAGSMAVPTWIALNFIPDWRWLLQREDSPWYPTVRLFRQSRLGDWSHVFQRIKLQLNAFEGDRH